MTNIFENLFFRKLSVFLFSFFYQILQVTSFGMFHYYINILAVSKGFNKLYNKWSFYYTRKDYHLFNFFLLALFHVIQINRLKCEFFTCFFVLNQVNYLNSIWYYISHFLKTGQNINIRVLWLFQWFLYEFWFNLLLQNFFLVGCFN